MKLNSLVSNGILEAYEPLADIKGSYSAQFEHVSWCVSEDMSWMLIVVDYPASRVA
jgi:methionine aminopeptidase